MKKIISLILLSAFLLTFLCFYSCNDSKIDETTKYTVTFDTDGGEFIGSIEVYYNQNVTLPSPQKEEYDFVKWVIKGTDTTVSSGLWKIKESVELLAIWEDNYTRIY